MKNIILAVLTAGILTSAAFAETSTATDANSTQNGTKSYSEVYTNVEIINGHKVLVVSTFYLIPFDDVKITNGKNGKSSMKMSWGEWEYKNSKNFYEEKLKVSTDFFDCLKNTSADGLTSQTICKQK